MTENTKIEWAHHTFNPWIGCTKVGPGCDHCYAAAQDNHRQWTPEGWGVGRPRRRTSEANWKQPLRWNRRAAKEGVRYRVFCASLADVFDNEVDPTWRADLFALIGATPNLDWLLLTKRIGNASRMIYEASKTTLCLQGPWDWRLPDNVWMGATIVNQPEAERDIWKLLEVPARIRFLSMEPLLGPVDIRPWLPCPMCLGWAMPTECDSCDGTGPTEDDAIDWVIAGGESGRNARPSHPDWLRSLRDQSVAAGVAFHFKQWGEWVSEMHPAADPSHQGTSDQFVEYLYDDEGRAYDYRSVYMCRVGKKAAGRELDGRTWDQVPA